MVLIYLLVCQGPIIRLVPNSVGNPFLTLWNRGPLIDIEEVDLINEGLLQVPNRS